MTDDTIVIPADRLPEFWRNIYPDGMTLERALAELNDIHMLIDHCTKIYSHFSGGMISKPNTLPFEVIHMSDRREQEELEEHVEDILNVISEVHNIPIEELKDCV